MLYLCNMYKHTTSTPRTWCTLMREYYVARLREHPYSSCTSYQLVASYIMYDAYSKCQYITTRITFSQLHQVFYLLRARMLLYAYQLVCMGFWIIRAMLCLHMGQFIVYLSSNATAIHIAKRKLYITNQNHDGGGTQCSNIQRYFRSQAYCESGPGAG